MKRFKQRIDKGDVIQSPTGEFYLVIEVDARIAELEKAMRDIIDPIAAMRRDLPQGYKLDGRAAYEAANDPQTYKAIARKALGL